jgi:cobaltochelatase CobN
LELEPKVGERAKYRIFSAPPGAYGAGVNLAIEASAWENEEDLRDVYINWGGYAYGRDVHGEKVHDSFALNLKGVEVSFNKLETDEADALDCCCFFGYHGGLTIAAKSLSGREVKTYWGDTRDPNHPHVRDMKDEMERIVRTRLLNPKWLEGKKRHGYKGAGDISSRVLHVYGWDATAGVVEDWVYDEILSRIVSDMRDWFMENNPYALEEICRRLLEANERGLWAASKEDLEQLRQIYLDLEGLLEDEERKGEFQGGEIVVKTKRDVAEWEENVRGIERAWKEIL